MSQYICNFLFFSKISEAVNAKLDNVMSLGESFTIKSIIKVPYH